MDGPQTGESHLLAVIQGRLGPLASGPGVERGIGDDAAVLVPPAGRLVATVDMVVEGQHFRLGGPRSSSLADVGWRALAVNLSDVAAMAARPLWALCSLGLPGHIGDALVEELYAGMGELAAAHGVAVVGGNLARVPERLVVDLTLIGHAERPLLRTGARPGDLLVLTGRVGLAAAGLALAEASPSAAGATRRGRRPAPDHWAGLPASLVRELDAARLRPRPRVAEGLAVARLDPEAVHAACDVSDGLAVDAARLCPRGCGVILSADALPLPEAARAAAATLGADPLRWALHGGEDYELLLAVAPDAAGTVVEALSDLAGARVVGTIAAGAHGVALVPEPGGPATPVPMEGWDPFRAGTTGR